jgi:hypothetical protein
MNAAAVTSVVNPSPTDRSPYQVSQKGPKRCSYLTSYQEVQGSISNRYTIDDVELLQTQAFPQLI